MNRIIRMILAATVVLAAFALADCSRAKIDPDVRLQQGLALQRAGNLDQAGDAYQDVLSVRLNDKYALYNLGVIAQGDGQTQLAEGYYRAALDTDPGFEPALFNLAIIRTSVGATQEAMDLYRRVIVVNPKNAGAHFNLGILLQKADRRIEAVAELNVAIRLDPSLADRLASNPILPGGGTGGSQNNTSASVTSSASPSTSP